MQAYQHDWKQHVLRLKNYFERQGLQNVDPSGERYANSSTTPVLLEYWSFVALLFMPKLDLSH